MFTRSCNTFCDVSLCPAPLSCPAHVTRRPEVIPFQSALSRHPQQRPTRDVSTAAAALSTKPGPIVTLVQQQLKDVAVGLEPKSHFLISYGVGCVLVPLLGGWLAITLIHFAARRARAWCDANPDDTAVTELFGMLPPALEYPSVVTVMIMVAVRVLRNAAWMVDTYVHRFTPKLNRAVDALVEIFCGYLVPIDQTLIKLYSIVGVVFLTVAFIKAKTVVLEFFLVKAQQESLQSSGRKGSVGTVEDFERLLVPLDALASWLASLTGGLICAQILGVSLAPLLAVGGASGIIIGLATQQLLTNAFMGLSLFFTRPFVAGDSVTCQGGGVMLTGVVERVTPMRTYIRTEDDIIVTVPNKTVADMVVYNRSTSIKRSRLAAANRKTDPLKLRIKVPHTASAKLGEVQAAVTSVLSTTVMRSRRPASPTATAAAAGGGGSSSGSKVAAGSVELGRCSSGGSWSSVDLGGDAPLVQPGSIEVQLSKFTDAGIELLVKANLRDEITSPAAQDMLLELSSQVRAAGAVLVNL